MNAKNEADPDIKMHAAIADVLQYKTPLEN